MANIIPIMSSSPPPLDEGEGSGWDTDDDFGTFTGAASIIDHAADTGMTRPELCAPTVIASELRHPIGLLLDHSVSPPTIKSENGIDGTELTETSYLPHDYRHESVGIVTKGLELSQNVLSSGECGKNSNGTNVPLTDSGVYSLNISPVQQCDYNSEASHVHLEHSVCVQQSQRCCSELRSMIVTADHDSRYVHDQTTLTVAHSENISFSMGDSNIGAFDSDNLVISQDGSNNIPEIDIPLGEHNEDESQSCVQQSQTIVINARSLSLDRTDAQQENCSNGFLFEGSSICPDIVTETFPITNQEVNENAIDRNKDCQLNVCTSAQHNTDDANSLNDNLKALSTPCDSCVITNQPASCDSVEEPCSTNVECELFSDKPAANAKGDVYSKSYNYVVDVELSENGNTCNVTTCNMSPCDKYTDHADENVFSADTAHDEVHLWDNGTVLVEHSDDMQHVEDAYKKENLAELSKSHINVQEFCTITVVKDQCEKNEHVILSDISSTCDGYVDANSVTSSEHDNDFKNDDSNRIAMNDFANFNPSVDDEIHDSDQLEDWAAFSDVNTGDKVSSECDIVDKSDKLSQECDGWNAFSTLDKPDSALKVIDPAECDGKSDDWAAFSGQQTITDMITDNEDMEEWAGFEDEESFTSMGTIPVQSSEERLSKSEFQNMSKQEKLVYTVMMCFPHLMTDTETMEDKLTTLPEANNRDTVWDHVAGQNTTEALLYQWTKSEWNAQLFSTLHIDTKNILIGHKKAPVPVFASGLGILEPTKGPAHPLKPDALAERTTSDGLLKSDFQESIPTAQFDWSGSGLTNPLEANNKTLNLDFLIQDQAVKSSVLESELLRKEESLVHKFTLQPLENILNLKMTSSSFRGTNQIKQMSDEAKKVIQSLPELSFMMSRVLMFPLKTDS